MSKLLSVKGLTKVYFGIPAVDHVDFSIEKGTVCGLLGPNGAGKTTIMKMLVGLLEKTEGEIHYDEGVKVNYLQDVPEFYEFYTVEEYLSFVLDLYHVKAGKAERIRDMMEELGLTQYKNLRIKKLSRGNRQRLGIAAAVISGPDLLILDEPVSALDPMGRKDVFDLLGKLKGKMTIIFSSHILTDVERLCDHVLMLDRGKLLYGSAMKDIQLSDNILSIRFLSKEDCWRFAGFMPAANVIDDTSAELTTDHLSDVQNEVFALLAREKLGVESVQTKKYTLEEVFIKEVQRSGKSQNAL